ncbi:MAG: agglutinin biogenesis protein MshP [Duganella sp.]
MHRRSSGVALVTAIFLLLVLAGLGVAVVSLTTSQKTAAVQDEQGARAYQAARAGMEWALFTQLQGAGLNCPANFTFAMPAGTTLSAFTVTVSCTAPSAGFGPNNPVDASAGHFVITSTACNGPPGVACPGPTNSPEYVQRVISSQL